MCLAKTQAVSCIRHIAATCQVVWHAGSMIRWPSDSPEPPHAHTFAYIKGLSTGLKSKSRPLLPMSLTFSSNSHRETYDHGEVVPGRVRRPRELYRAGWISEASLSRSIFGPGSWAQRRRKPPRNPALGSWSRNLRRNGFQGLLSSAFPLDQATISGF